MPPPTRGNVVSGQAAAVLGLAETSKFVTGARPAVGYEMLLDLERHELQRTRLVRNPDCTFFHERWQLEPVDDIELGEIVSAAQPALGASDAERGSIELALPGRVFAVRAECVSCRWQEPWAITFAHDSRLAPCPSCGAPRRATGFAQRESVRVDALPAEWLRRRPGALGLSAGDVIELRSGGARLHLELAPGGEPVVPFAKGDAHYDGVVVNGLGNIGSQLVPQLARIPGVERVTLVDFDHYERHQQRYQAITAADADAGRPKVEVAAEAIRRIAPALDVHEYPMPLEAVPLGALRNSVVVGALDSIGARLRLAQRAWHVGSPFVDTGVAGGDSLLARVTVFAPNDQGPCFCCSLDANHDVSATSPCDVATAR